MSLKSLAVLHKLLKISSPSSFLKNHSVYDPNHLPLPFTTK